MQNYYPHYVSVKWSLTISISLFWIEWATSSMSATFVIHLALKFSGFSIEISIVNNNESRFNGIRVVTYLYTERICAQLLNSKFSRSRSGTNTQDNNRHLKLQNTTWKRKLLCYNQIILILRTWWSFRWFVFTLFVMRPNKSNPNQCLTIYSTEEAIFYLKQFKLSLKSFVVFCNCHVSQCYLCGRHV